MKIANIIGKIMIALGILAMIVNVPEIFPYIGAINVSGEELVYVMKPILIAVGLFVIGIIVTVSTKRKKK